jgi:hypothetical protein
LIRIWKMKKTSIEELSNIPLLSEEPIHQNERP